MADTNAIAKKNRSENVAARHLHAEHQTVNREYGNPGTYGVGPSLSLKHVAGYKAVTASPKTTHQETVPNFMDIYSSM